MLQYFWTHFTPVLAKLKVNYFITSPDHLSKGEKKKKKDENFDFSSLLYPLR